VSERIKKEEAPKKVYAVELEETSQTIKNVSTRVETNRFYSLEDGGMGEEIPNAIAAVVQEDQQVQEGSIVKMRLTQMVFINGVELPENYFVYGVAQLNNNRMQVRVNGVQYGGNVLPVSLTVFSEDGMEGLPVQGGALKGAGNQVIDRSLQSVGVNGLNMGIGAQVAGAAVQAGKSLLKKNAKAVKITLTAGYPVLLKNVQ
jgi:conjugative transposon TraM protein